MSERKLPRVKTAEVVSGFIVRISFTDGTEKRLDLAGLMKGPIFQEIREDPARFRELRVDSELGTIVWPNGADIDPDVLYGSDIPSGEGDVRAS
jgi:hypothetical protein